MCDHGHSHGGCAGEAQQSTTPIVMRYDMHQFVDKDKVTVLNEAQDGTGKLVFKDMESRLDRSTFVLSDCDEELLFNIPFTGHVRLTGLSIIGEEESSHPAIIRLFKDKPAMSFDDCSIEADQEISLKMDPQGQIDYPLKASKFTNITHLSVQVTKNFGSDETKVFYIGLRGEFQHDFRQRVAIATYEARAIPEDHKGEIPEGNHFEMM
ncbi:unnamed protein product [Auanema sp. JU1783]|nr:unnamed protein product [Auanema sp. JU1783]